jgi:uncharacterized protein
MERLRFATEDGVSLEAEARMPDAGVRGSAVICHPHPRHGGSKDHPVLWAIRNDLAARGLAVLTFNFRGVMGSDGEYGGGVAETNDVRSAIGTIRDRVAGPTFVAGWSFGANVALRESLTDDRVAALALLGFPLSDSSLVLPELPDRTELKAFTRPVLLLSGQADPFSPLPELRSLGRRLGDATVEVVAGTDHFFWHREKEAAQTVGAFAERALFGQP